MKKEKLARFRLPTLTEQELLIGLVVEPVPPDQVERLDELITEHHYLKNARVVGEHLRYVARYQGQWLALATWSAAALHIKPRDRFIGWSEEQRRMRLPLVVNNSRLLVLPPCECPNLISRFMKLMIQRLSSDWEQSWKHPVARTSGPCRTHSRPRRSKRRRKPHGPSSRRLHLARRRAPDPLRRASARRCTRAAGESGFRGLRAAHH